MVMVLDRGKLAKIDRRLLAELDHGEGPQTVKVPLSDAAWSTWRRYCDVLGLTMGEGIAGLIDSELTAVVDVGGLDSSSVVFAGRAEEQLVAREAQIGAREHDVMAAEERLRRQNERLRHWSELLRIREDELDIREWRLEATTNLSSQRQPAGTKVGRNERCPCGSGLKYKHCHGLPGRQTDRPTPLGASHCRFPIREG